tara:strand:- start:4644 stop:5246 length:603 start_codon:yes stop_codon:yes gene_type:complete
MTSLFKLHNPLINIILKESPDNLRKGVEMVSLSIKRPWKFVGVQIKEYKSQGFKAKCIKGPKEKTMNYLSINKHSLYREAMNSLKYTGRRRKVEMMLAFLDVPGIGLVKAGFCCQLFDGVVGCIDSHNVKMYNVSPNLLSYDKDASLATRIKKINIYLDLCQSKRSDRLWNKWCRNLAKQDKRFKDAEEVSELHFRYLLI